ncbi:2-hydroxyisoflavanone dehydratase-like [Aegilops tauschii subsp. strangulata]|uniref:2-hydroxyisoflavanone dehydratase-like n=1 Tax=Aegilops tauschii subsp. strangulata TaxID=200361 RepID=UPI003CC87D85
MQRTTQKKSFKLKQLNCAMHANKTSPAKQKEGRDISVDMYPFIRKYKDGSIERFLRSPFVLASPDQGGNRGVATRDVVVDKATGVSVRLFLPSRAADTAGRNRLPLVIYVHGGSFCTESAFGRTYHRYATSLAASAGALVVSVEYRLAPEFPRPAAYDDAWAALQWAASSSDPWPEFPPYGVDRLWPFVTAGQAGNDDPRIDPPASEISSLACRRVLIAVAGKDTLRDRGLDLAARMRDHDAPWPWMTPGRREVTVVESEGEDHGFHLYCPLRATSKRLMGSIVEFINQQPSSSPANPMVLGVPTTLFKDVFGYGTTMKSWGTRSSMAHNRAHGSGAHGPVWPSNKISVRLPMPAEYGHLRK